MKIRSIIYTAGLTLGGYAAYAEPTPLVAQATNKESPALEKSPTEVPEAARANQQGTQGMNVIKTVKIQFDKGQTALDNDMKRQIDRQVRSVGAENVLSTHVVAWGDGEQPTSAPQSGRGERTTGSQNASSGTNLAEVRTQAIESYLSGTHNIENVETFDMSEPNHMYSQSSNAAATSKTGGTANLIDTRRIQSVKAQGGESIALVLLETPKAETRSE